MRHKNLSTCAKICIISHKTNNILQINWTTVKTVLSKQFVSTPLSV